MGQQTIPILKDKFADGKTPPGSDFADLIDSYYHKSTKINQAQVLGLNEDFATKDELNDATTKFKGYHTTLAELQAEYPQADNQKDFFAWLGSPYPGTVWKVYANGGAWNDTGEVPTQQEIDLAEYAKKIDLVKKADLKNAVNDQVVYAPDGTIDLSKIDDLSEQLYGEQKLIETIPYNAIAGIAIQSTVYWTYADMTSIYGKRIDHIKLDIMVTGILYIAVSNALNGSAPRWAKEVMITSVGVNNIEIGVTLKAGEYLLLKGAYKWKNGTANPIGGSVTGVNGTYIADLCVGIFTGEVPDGEIADIHSKISELRNLINPEHDIPLVETIPYDSSKPSSATDVRTYGYINQDVLRGKIIHSLKLKMAKDGVFSATFSDNKYGIGGWRKDFNLSAGEHEVEIGRILALNEFLCFGGAFMYSGASANPIGGGFDGDALFPNGDLCIGITTGGNIINDVIEPVLTPNRLPKLYYALGDSITQGTGASVNQKGWAYLMSNKLGTTITNTAVGGRGVMGANGLISQVNQVPANFTGLITVMMGINNVGGSPLGNADDTLAKDIASLTVTDNFSDAFRFCMETLVNKCPKSIIYVVLPLNATMGTKGEFFIEQYRAIERRIAEYLNIPCSELYQTCGINPTTYATLMPDKLHPNDAGHKIVSEYAYSDIVEYIKKSL